MVYLFEVSPMDVPALVQQVSCALEARAEFLFRRRHPRLWRLEELRRQKTRQAGGNLSLRRNLYRAISVLIWLLGVFLMVASLTVWQGMVLPPVAGAMCLGAGLCGLWRYGRTLLIALSLIKGALFCLGAFRCPEKMGVLLPFAAMGVVVGIAGLAAVQIPRHSRFTHQAEQLLHKSGRASGVQVSFSMDGMRYFIRSQTGFSLTGVGPIVPYQRFEAVIETEELFLLLYYEDAVTILQKKDLPAGQLENFRKFIARRALLLQSMEGKTRVWEEGKREEAAGRGDRQDTPR